MSMLLPSQYTSAMVRELPDDGHRYESINGTLLVTPPPAGRHQDVLFRLIRVLDRYLSDHDRADLMGAPADISFDENTLVQPDLFVADLTQFHASGQWSDIRDFYLVIEIVAPSSAWADRHDKRRLYQAQHVPAYWVVDAEQRQVEVWTPHASQPVIERVRLEWQHPAIDMPCVVELDRLFA
jgi:Uma2 family endonuclease